MRKSQPFPILTVFAGILLLALLPGKASPAQSSKVMGKVRFEGDTGTDRDAGIWIDGDYVGYVKPLKGNKKVLLLPGKHEIRAREAGYSDFVKQIIVEPGDLLTVDVKMLLAPGAEELKTTVEPRVTIHPKRAAVFLHGNYVGHAGELGGRFRSSVQESIASRPSCPAIAPSKPRSLFSPAKNPKSRPNSSGAASSRPPPTSRNPNS